MHYTFFDFLVLLGSLGLFLHGMRAMSEALMELAGDRMRSILATATSNRLFAVLTGLSITATIQSSSATTLMVVSFANASLLTLPEAIGVIMGANIGTTATAWLISILGFKLSISSVAIPLLGLGFLLSLSRQKSVAQWGHFIIGFSLLFIGLEYLKGALPDLNSNPQALAFLAEYTSLGYFSVILFVVLGTLLTLVTQSSSATMALTMVICYEGWIPFEMAAAMVLGENIGTTVTANLAALVANYQAKRAAIAHLVFNLIGVLWMMLLFTWFIGFIDFLVQKIEHASPLTQVTAIPVGLSLFHTAFNVVNTALLIWFVPGISRIAQSIIPETPEAKVKMGHPKYLDEISLKYPQTAIKALLDESLRMFEKITFKVVSHGFNIHREDIESDEDLKKALENLDNVKININEIYDQKIKHVYSEIVEYASRLQGRFEMNKDKIKKIRRLLRANRQMIDIIDKTRRLQQNMSHYLQSENLYIRDEYKDLRKMILQVLWEVRHVKAEASWVAHKSKYQALLDDIDRHDVKFNDTIYKLVRKHHLTGKMAISLMKDSSAATQIARDLVGTSAVLYSCCRDDFQHDDDHGLIEGKIAKTPN